MKLFDEYDLFDETKYPREELSSYLDHCEIREFHVVSHFFDGESAMASPTMFVGRLYVHVSNEAELGIEFLLDDMIVESLVDACVDCASSISFDTREPVRPIRIQLDENGFRCQKLWIRKHRSTIEPSVRFGDAIPIGAVDGKRLDDKWFQCGHCFDAWEPKCKREYVLCPSCGRAVRLDSKE